jgi:hypothetical protein
METKNQKFNMLIILTILFYVIYGVLLVLVGTIPFEITIYVPISEGSGYPVPFATQFKVASLIELMLNAPLVAIFFYLIYTQIMKKEDEKSLKYINWIKLFTAIIIAIGIMGIGIHFTANLFNTIKEMPIGTPDPTAVLIYWLDEIVGHHLIHIGIFGFFVAMMIFEYGKKTDEMLSIEFKGFPIWAAIVGLGFGVALAEGQCSFTFLIVYSIAIVILFVIKMYISPFSFKNKPLIWFNLFFYIGNLSAILILGIINTIFGLAFFAQPHLLF